MKRANDLDKDVVRDTVKTKKSLLAEFQDKNVPGFIQCVQISPAKITLYSYLQMEVLKVLQENQPVSLFLDATGSLCRALGDIYDDGRMLLYSVVALSPIKGRSPVPITEMVSTDNTHANIFSWLYEFFHR